VRSIVMSLSVCLSARITQKPRSRTSNFVCILLVALVRSSSDGVAIRYVLPVLSMTSCFYAMDLTGRIKHGVMFRRRQTTTVFG